MHCQLTPLAYPSAAASHIRDLPLGDSMFNLLSITKVMGPNIRFAPAATAMVLSPVLSCWTARCTAAKDELQAVSIVICRISQESVST